VFRSAFAFTFAAAPFCAFCAAGCTNNANDPYTPTPAYSGKKVNLPSPPSLPTTPIKTGEAFTVYGAAHHFRSIVHNKEVTSKEVTIVGYIVDSNIPKAPACAVHPTGKKDPDNCTDIPLPMFAIADVKGDAKGDDKRAAIKVVGWARNFAVIYDAMKEYSKVRAGDKPKELVKDGATDVPFPLPAVGAKVKITGMYNYSATVSSGMVADPINGVLTYKSLEVLEPAPEAAAFAKKI
jgi:hypothetical protein